jgi:hypothetical protein
VIRERTQRSYRPYVADRLERLREDYWWELKAITDNPDLTWTDKLQEMHGLDVRTAEARAEIERGKAG